MKENLLKRLEVTTNEIKKLEIVYHQLIANKSLLEELLKEYKEEDNGK